jgi:thiamine-phosphate pyrophosphorylase
MLVTDRRRSRMPLLDLIEAAAAGGVDAVYLRDLDCPPTRFAALVQEIRQRTGESLAILVNGGPEVAFSIGTGLHLRERAMAPAEARAVLGPRALIGKSVHSVEAAAAATGADYLLAGHVYRSASKPGIPPLGLAMLAPIATAAPCPVLAIGGITAGRIPEVITAGAAGVAAIGAIAEADDPTAAAAALRVALARAQCERKEHPAMTDSDNTAPLVEIVVNGKSVSVSVGSTVHDFLTSRRMTDAMAIVERNGEIVPRADYDATALDEGDKLEVVHAVGGG